MNRSRMLLPFLLICVLTLLMVIPGESAKADVGVPPAHPGYSLSPGDLETNVQMVSEVVEIKINENPFKADVAASFQMRNNSTEVEIIEVWFPLGEVLNWGKKDRVFQVADFQAWVDGNEMDITIEQSDEWKLIWAHWTTAFPAETPIEILVSYKLSPSWDNSPAWCGRFDYILETGAGWQGVIEKAEISIQAPYPLDGLNNLLGFGDAFFVTPGGYTLNNSDIRWVFIDLEPTDQDNINFSLLEPETWYAIYNSYKTLETSPDDWEAYVALARGLSIWKGSQESAEYHGFPDTSIDTAPIANLIGESWKKALELSPPDVDLYGSALRYFKWNPDILQPYQMQNYFNTAIEFFPDDEQIGELYEAALADGLIVEGAASISPTPPPPTATVIPDRPLETDIAAGSSNARNSPSLTLIIGVLFIIAAAVLLIIAIKRRGN